MRWMRYRTKQARIISLTVATTTTPACMQSINWVPHSSYEPRKMPCINACHGNGDRSDFLCLIHVMPELQRGSLEYISVINEDRIFIPETVNCGLQTCSAVIDGNTVRIAVGINVSVNICRCENADSVFHWLSSFESLGIISGVVWV